MILPLVCIGGIGGSGTRVYSKIINEAGVHLGKDLNIENDNLIFTRLFKNPIWHSIKREIDFKNRINWFLTLMNGINLPPEDQASILQVFKNNQFYKLEGKYDFNRLVHNENIDKWGWKEPNSHIYIKELATELPKLKYIFIIRDGLDMSLSPNIQQLTNWGGNIIRAIN